MLFIFRKKRWMKLEEDISDIKSEISKIKDICANERHILEITKQNLDSWNSDNIGRVEKNKLDIEEQLAKILHNLKITNNNIDNKLEKNTKVVTDAISDSSQKSINELKKIEQQINDLDLTTKIALLQNVIQNIDIISNNGDI